MDLLGVSDGFKPIPSTNDLQRLPHSPSPMPDRHLSAKDAEKGRFAFSIYDFEGNGTMDAYYLGDCLRAVNLNPTNARIEKEGGTKMKKQKYLTVDDFLTVFAEVKNRKDTGSIEDYIECLRLYDKHDDGKMLLAELQHILLAVGEPLTDAEVKMILHECCEEEDEDGFVNYAPFLQKVMSTPLATH